MELGNGTVAVVTGGASGIGLAMANAFASAGCSVVLSDVQADALAAAEAEVGAHGVATMSVLTDVSDREQVDALATAVMERFGAVHVVCNNAGVASRAEPWAGSIEAWEWTMGVNFWGVVYGVRAFLPLVAASGGGHIVNTASIAGLFPGFGPSYAASKHAVVAITESLYHSVAMSPVPIGVSCVCPGWVRTGIMDADRNWPSDRGELPLDDELSAVQIDYVRRAIDEGTQPAAVADLVVDAVRSNRYWVFPHPDFLEIAVQRFHSIAEQLDPAQPEQVPGMPPTEQLMAETLAALFPDGVPDA